MKKNVLLITSAIVIMSFIGCAIHDFKYPFLTGDQLKDIKDGVYAGEVNQGWDIAKVEVTIEKGKISKVVILDVFAHGWRKQAIMKKLPERFVSTGGSEIDGISGATGSVNAVKIAVSKALGNAIAEKK